MAILHIETLMFNPIFTSKIIQCFMTGYEKELDFKMIFYILPVVMYKDARERLNSARSDSTIYSIFAKEINFKEYGTKLNSKLCLKHVKYVFEDYIKITKQSIIILANQEKISISNIISLQEKLPYNKTPNLIRDYFKAAFYLGKMLKGMQIEEFEDLIGLKLDK
ncbi:hypothetical protein I6U48_00925 [Clostridium sp. PL3]|uniref:Uncharacterized protein n=1 Tax=Clostridium thailandense TaxID=2794346 RepID=A0A949TUZ0_9CLOT|nr:three component ABC system middle component [Clostridium thailandense]MBV7271483.1 hypothetical protein [Clostridium thailandense]